MLGTGSDRGLLVDLGEDLRVADEEVLVVADLDRVAAPAGEEDLVARLDRGGDELAVLVGGAGAGGDDAGFGKRGGGNGGREEDAGRGLGLGLEALDQDAVQERDDRLDGADGGLGSLLRASMAFRESEYGEGKLGGQSTSSRLYRVEGRRG